MKSASPTIREVALPDAIVLGLAFKRGKSMHLKHSPNATLFFLILMPSTLLFTGTCSVYGAPARTTSQNYLKSVNLPREGEPAKSSQTELERVVSKHNQTLTENPAAKNRNRIVYVNGPDQYKPVRFPVAPNTAVVDGSGRLMGHLAPDVHTVEINFGQHKLIDGKDHVMAFSTRTKENGGVTGWIAASALLPSTVRSQFASELAMNVEDTSEQGDAPESYRVRCGPTSKWGDGRLKVRAKVDDRREKHIAATDYVARPGGVCYLLTSLPRHGGVATDILSNGAKFVPDAGVPRVELPLYLPVDSTNGERNAWGAGKLPHEMEFRYGRVGKRYGWIASADLRK